MLNQENNKMTSRPIVKLLVMASVLAVVLAGASSCTKVSPGYVGIKVNNWGSQKGVQDYPLKTGMVFYNPLTEDMYDFPTFMVTRTWTQNINEGNPIDESITFNSIEGTQVNADVAITYFFDPHDVPEIFVKFRAKPDILTDGYIHNRVRDFLNREASDMKVVDIFGQGKQKILNKSVTLRTNWDRSASILTASPSPAHCASIKAFMTLSTASYRRPRMRSRPRTKSYKQKLKRTR